MEMTLLLNSTYEPLRVVHWQKAIALLWQGKVEVLEVYDREIHGVSISFKLPAVMRLLKLVRLKDSHRAVKFSRINIFTRDGYVCQYCRSKYRTEELTSIMSCRLPREAARPGKIL
jgi:5-methylcytosine-specific restriction endonuclease McrA